MSISKIPMVIKRLSNALYDFTLGTPLGIEVPRRSKMRFHSAIILSLLILIPIAMIIIQMIVGQTSYHIYMSIAFLLLIIAMWLNHTRFNSYSILLTIATLNFITLVVVIFSRDFNVVYFLTGNIIISSILTSLKKTIGITILNIGIIISVFFFFQYWTILSLVNPIFFTLGVGVMSIFTAAITQSGSQQIETQTKQLIEENEKRALAEAELLESKNHLEQKVVARTAELEVLNSQLEQELATRKNLYKLLAENEKRYRTLVEAFQDTIFIIDQQGTIEYMNKFGAILFGKDDPDEIIGKPFVDIFPLETSTNLGNSLEKVFETNRSQWVSEQVMITNHHLWLNTGLFPISSENGLVQSVLGVSRNITTDKLNVETITQQNLQLEKTNKVLNNYNDKIKLVNEMTSLSQACENAVEIYQVFSSYLSKIFENSGGFLFIYNTASKRLELKVSWAVTTSPEQSVLDVDACWALRKGGVHIVDDNLIGVECFHMGNYHDHSYMCIPLVAIGEPQGLLTLLSLPDQDIASPSFISEDKQILAKSVAETISLSMANIQMREKLRDEAIRDPLTNLLNRRFMEEAVLREINQSEQRDYPLGIIIFDIDHFKLINDTYGHSVGDIIIIEIGNYLKKFAQMSDIACRYDGDEFVMLMPDTSLKNIIQRANKLRVEIEEISSSKKGHNLPLFTISIGISTYPENGSTYTQLLSAADKALYRAKANGRNRVEIADQTPS